MELNFITENYVPVIVVASLVIGFLIKHTPKLDKATPFIPVVVAVLGAVMGATLNGLGADAITYGAVSGLASTGLHQAFSKLLGLIEAE